MFQTRVFEYESGRWVPVMVGYVAECGHWHWYELRPQKLREPSPFRPINFPIQASLADHSIRRPK